MRPAEESVVATYVDFYRPLEHGLCHSHAAGSIRFELQAREGERFGRRCLGTLNDFNFLHRVAHGIETLFTLVSSRLQPEFGPYRQIVPFTRGDIEIPPFGADSSD